MDTSLENKLYKSGYVWDPRLNKTYLGDLQINLSKMIQSSDQNKDTQQYIQPILVVPTANDQDIQDLYGLKAGERRWGLGLKYGIEKQLPSRIKLNFSTTGTHLFSSRQARRLPKASDDALNENLDPDTEVNGGTKLQSQIQARYSFPTWVGINTGLLWQKKLDESLRGSRFSPEAYQTASSRSGYELLSSYVSVDLNSIQSFLAGNFLFPGSAEIGASLPLSGRNSIAEPVFEFQGTMFF